MRVPEEGNRYLSYREIAPKLADYASEMGFTHVELMPVPSTRPSSPGATRRSASLPRPAGTALPRI